MSALGEGEYESEFEDEYEGEEEGEEFDLGGVIGGLLGEGEGEYEYEYEDEASHSMNEAEAMAEMMAAIAAGAESEAEAEAMIGAATVTVLSARDRAELRRLLPHLVRASCVLTRILRRRRGTRPAVAAVPSIVRGTARDLARRASAGRPGQPPRSRSGNEPPDARSARQPGALPPRSSATREQLGLSAVPRHRRAATPGARTGIRTAVAPTATADARQARKDRTS